MSKQPYPIALPDDLLEEVKRTAAEAHLSMEEAMHQAIRFGLPKVRKGSSQEEDFTEAAADTWNKIGPPPTILYDEL